MPAVALEPPCGVVLAAGAGRRFGGPKALARTPLGTPWVALAVRALRAGGCGEIIVALGASADEAAPLVPPEAAIVLVPDWASGVAASLRASLASAASGTSPAAIVMPVDTPDASPAAIARLVRRAEPEALAQAVYDGSPGHPVLIGRAHWDALSAAVSGDIGARPYLIAQNAELVECGDLWSGMDRDER